LPVTLPAFAASGRGQLDIGSPQVPPSGAGAAAFRGHQFRHANSLI
jgi:hypothetical protein